MTAAAIDLAGMASMLDENPDYRVLRRFRPRDRYTEGTPSDLRRGAFCDCETTGVDVDADEITELALLPFTFDRVTGRIYDVGPGLAWLNEPTIPIPEVVQAKTGITPELVKGHKLDTVAVARAVDNLAIVVAHCSRFDRKMVERVVPAFQAVAWGCTQEDVDWEPYGVAGGALQNVLITATGEFPDTAHRALVDCAMGVHVLTAEREGRTALSELLDAARAGVARVCAIDSPIECKGLLRQRNYRALYVCDRFQYWHKDVPANRPDEIEAEKLFCVNEAYASPRVKQIGARDRFSVRAER